MILALACTTFTTVTVPLQPGDVVRALIFFLVTNERM